MRSALRVRYELLPFWYTEFYLCSLSGVPVARPLWVEFPRDKNTYNMDDQYMVGSSLLVHPITEQYATTVHLYLPGSTAVSFQKMGREEGARQEWGVERWGGGGMDEWGRSDGRRKRREG